MLKRIDQFPYKHAKDIALRTLICNGFSAYCKNVILSMLADDDETIHSKAFEIVMSIRKSKAGELTPDNANPKATSVRTFIIPQINVEANFYQNVVDFDRVDVTEP